MRRTTSRAGSGRPRQRSTSPTSPRSAAPGRCCGTSTRRARPPTSSGCTPRSGAAAAACCRENGRSTTSSRHRFRPARPAPGGLPLSQHGPRPRRGQEADPAVTPTAPRRQADEYDVIILDCPPSVSLVSENVLEATDVLVVPLIPTTLSVRTFEQLQPFIADYDGRRPAVRAFFSMADRRKALHREVMATLHTDGPEMTGSSCRPPARSSRWPSGGRRWPPSRRPARRPVPTRSCGTAFASRLMSRAAPVRSPARRSSPRPARSSPSDGWRPALRRCRRGSTR